MTALLRRIGGYGVRVVASLLFLMALVADAGAQSAPSCELAAKQWAARCAAQGRVEPTPLRCAVGFATFRVAHQGASLDVEVRAEGGSAFRRVAHRGLSPIGEFTDWSQAPSELRAAFDAFASCVESGMPDSVFLSVGPKRDVREPASASPERRSFETTSLRLWAALAAMAVVGIAWARRRHRGHVLRTSAMLLGLGLATWALRRLVLPFAFFHQNGHGPMWVDCALGGHCSYGPGFRELFGAFAMADRAAADEGVFLAHSVLAATAPIAAWALARAVSAPRLLALSLALVVAIEPGLSRLSQSESYFGVVAWLLFAAAALLATAARFASPRSLVFVAAMSGAGMLIAQAAVVHPIAWVPSALVPLVVLLVPGSSRRRWRRFAMAMLGTGLVAAAASGLLVLRIYEAHRRWGGMFGEIIQQNLRMVVLGALLFGAFLLTLRLLRAVGSIGAHWPRLSHLALAALLLLLPVFTARALHPFGGLTPWIRHAWWAPYLPLALTAAAALLASLTRRRPLGIALASGAVVLLGAIFGLTSFRELTTLPTDALEARFVTSFRDELPEGARVLHLERANQRISTLPIYRDASRHVRTVRLTVGKESRALPGGELPSHYYRSSLCSTEDGRAFCERLESQLSLEPVVTAVLPALPSMPHLPYDTAEVAVGLYRIVGPAKQEAASSTTP